MKREALSRIMLVEDDPDILMISRFALESLGGFNVAGFSSGTEAIAGAAEFAPDMIVLDVMMPDLDGPTTLSRLRELPGLRQTPAVFLTAGAKGLDRSHAALGALAVINKPFDPMRLADQLISIWSSYEPG